MPFRPTLPRIIEKVRLHAIPAANLPYVLAVNKYDWTRT
jgi:hypothetical protein